MESVTLTKKGVRRSFYGPTEIVRARFEGWQDIPPEPAAPHRVADAAPPPDPGPEAAAPAAPADPDDDPAPDGAPTEHHKRRRPSRAAGETAHPTDNDEEK